MAMAATLLEIKARALLPVLEQPDDEDSPEKVLIRQLEEYKVFKEIVGELKECENVIGIALLLKDKSVFYSCGTFENEQSLCIICRDC